MSFFSNASGVNINGGTFYSASQGINIQNNLQLAIQEGESHSLVGVGARAVHGQDASQTAIEDGSFSAAEHEDTLAEGSATSRSFRYGPVYLISGGLRSPGWGRAGAEPPPLRDLFAHLYLPNLHRRLGPTQTTLMLEPPLHAQVVDFAGTALHTASGTMINASTPASNIDRPPATNIHGGTFVAGNVNNIQRNGESGIGILHRAVALAALHDAAESYPQPRCHPETRKELLETLRTWCADSNSDGSSDDSGNDAPILWLHGPAGAGKSAMMKTHSEQLQDAQKLGGTFFFKRGHPTRGNANVLFATIALQLAVNVPELNLPISRVVEANPTLVGRSLDVQLRDLIVEPCSTIECGLTRIILIDGLDECEGKDIQQDILRLLGDSVAQAPPPFRIIIASRPEPHIREVLEGSSFVGLYSPLNIDKSFEDIRAYLQSEFARIHREHSTMAAVSNPWPSPHAIERLVGKSSGYFIYASTVIKFIDDKDYRPTRRLAALEALPGPRSQSPFAALDALYRQILSETSDNPDLVPILRVICHLDFLKPWEIEELLGLESGDVELALRGLHSVIHDEQDSGLCVIHASFSDFLNDPSRAGDFYTGDVAGLEDLARLVLSELGYMYADVNKNRAPLLADSLGWRLESLLKQVPPSEDLACLFRAINPDFIHYSDLNVNVLLSWLQWIEPPQNDLVQMLEDYKFLDGTLHREPFEPLSEQQSARLMGQLAECPLLSRIFQAYLWTDEGSVDVIQLRYLLNISWDELRVAIRCLRLIFPDGLAGLYKILRFIQNSQINPASWRANISTDLAFGCIRLQKLIDTGNLPTEHRWWQLPQWGRLVRGSPCSTELLSSIKGFVPPGSGLYQEQECHDVIQWLKSFPKPPRDEISRWEMLFLDEQRQASERPPWYRPPPEDYDDRWRYYNKLCPE